MLVQRHDVLVWGVSASSCARRAEIEEVQVELGGRARSERFQHRRVTERGAPVRLLQTQDLVGRLRRPRAQSSAFTSTGGVRLVDPPEHRPRSILPHERERAFLRPRRPRSFTCSTRWISTTSNDARKWSVSGGWGASQKSNALSQASFGFFPASTTIAQSTSVSGAQCWRSAAPARRAEYWSSNSDRFFSDQVNDDHVRRSGARSSYPAWRSATWCWWR